MSVLERLATLIAWDTQNPGGNETALVAVLERDLAAMGPTRLFAETLQGGHAYVYAEFGDSPKWLLNAHIDTVPAAPGWSADPLKLRVADGMAFGLGSADTKGAVAAILEAIAQTPRERRNVAVLLSGDEERSGSVMRHFLAQGPGQRMPSHIEAAVVCEPTGLQLGVRHRGLLAASITATGPGGHSSRADDLAKPVLELAHLAIALDAWGATTPLAGASGMCMNVAEIRTGSPFNVIPAKATLDFSVRPPSGTRLADSEAALRGLVPPSLTFTLQATNPPFATRTLATFAERLGIPEGDARAGIDLDFWTEAALLEDAGIDAVVFGPGEISQAHAADERVPLAQLEAAVAHFTGVVGAVRGS